MVSDNIFVEKFLMQEMLVLVCKRNNTDIVNGDISVCFPVK